MRINSLGSQIPLRSFLSEHEFITEHGDVGTVLVTSPKDVECSEQEDINGIAERLTKAWRILDTRFRVYQHWFRTKNRQGLYENKTYLTLVHCNGKWSDNPWLFPRGLWSELKGDLDRRRASLAQKVKSWQEQCGDFWPMREASKQESFDLFWRLFNDEAPRPLLGDLHLNKQVACSEISWSPVRIGKRYESVLSLQYMPEDKKTRPYMLEPLSSIEAEFSLCIQSQACPIIEQKKTISRARSSQAEAEIGVGGYLKQGETGIKVDNRHRDQGALRNSQALADMEGDLSEGERLCLFSLSMVVHADSAEELEFSTESVKSAMDLKVRMVREGARRKLIFFSMCPGNHDLTHFREKHIGEASLADFSVLFETDAGSAHSKHLAAPAVVVLETRQRTPYHFNLHIDDEDVGHWLILGKTGSGKTVLSKKLIHSAQQYCPYTSIVDFAGTYKHLTMACKGSHTRVEIGSDAARMSPLAFPASKEQLDLATALVALLLEQPRGPLATDQVEDIYRAVVSFYASNEPRRLGALVPFLPEEYRRPLRRWVDPGQYSWLLDNEETLENESEFQCHEFVGMDDEDHKDLLEPMFMSKFHADNMVVRDPKRVGQLKIILIDEAWIAVQGARGIDFVRGGLKKARQHNAVFILSTQSPRDASGSPIWHVINQCTNKILLADPEMTEAEYANTFGFKPKQIEAIKGEAPKRELFVRTAGESGKVLILKLTDEENLLYATDSNTVSKINDAIERFGHDDWLRNMLGGHNGDGAGNGANGAGGRYAHTHRSDAV